MLTVGSLFSGIGGLDLGLERAGMKVLWQVEKDPYARRVLAKHWPDVPCFDDVTRFGGSSADRVDIICGGFPCQDISVAGKGAGIKEGTRSGLWIEYARIIREFRPRYVLVENVPALRNRGLDRVLGDLASCGYDAQWDGLSASAVGAPHRRDRIFIVAYAGSGAFHGEQGEQVDRGEQGWSGSPNAGRHGQPGSVANAESSFEPCESEIADPRGTLVGAGSRASSRTESWDPSSGGHVDRPDQESCGARPLAHADSSRSPLRCFESAREELAAFERGGSQGNAWALEPDVGRVAHGVPARVDRLRCLGNAVVPQVAEFVGRLIVAHSLAIADSA